MLEQIMTVGFVTAFLTASVRMAVPLIYAGLGETISEKAGILNIGMEGVMLGGAFFSFAGTFYSGSLAVGLLCGMAGGAMVSAIHGLLSIRLAQDQSVSGIAINIFMAGVTSFLYKLMSSGQSYQQIEPFAKLKIPFLGDIPLIGNALFNQDAVSYTHLDVYKRQAIFSADTIWEDTGACRIPSGACERPGRTLSWGLRPSILIFWISSWRVITKILSPPCRSGCYRYI